MSFEEIEPKTKGKRSRAKPTKSGELKRAEDLEQERLYTKENLQASIEEMQASNEELKSTNEEVQSALDYSECIVDTITQPLVITNDKLEVVSANRSFYSNFRFTQQETVGRYFYEIGERQWDIPSLRPLLDDILKHDTTFEKVEVDHEFRTIGRKKMILNARRILNKPGEKQLILLVIEDVTGSPIT